jgi:hypothetical protein
MEVREKPHADSYNEITSDCDYDATCTHTSLPPWDLILTAAFFLHRPYIQQMQTAPKWTYVC